MRLLLDTHLLIWTAANSRRLSSSARELIEDRGNDLLFSVASIWEITIKRNLDRGGLQVDPRVLRQQLLANGYQELAIIYDHAIAVEMLPPIHGDPFDRLLLAQAVVEQAMLLTADTTLATYPGPIRHV